MKLFERDDQSVTEKPDIAGSGRIKFLISIVNKIIKAVCTC